MDDAAHEALLRDIVRRLEALEQRSGRLSQLVGENARAEGLHYHDIMGVLDRLAKLGPRVRVAVETRAPIAAASDDHAHPLGAAFDNTRSPRFCARCEELFPAPMRYLDLGCSGGGLVLDFALRGHIAVGLEGSDLPKAAQRGEWRLLPDNLFLCDILEPFVVRDRDSGQPMRFHVISAWEVMEHLPEDRLPQLFANVTSHLEDGGLFIGSVATYPHTDPRTGAVYHRTVKPRAWWEQAFRSGGLAFTDDHPFRFEDYCRGTNNGLFDSANFRLRPELGFHFVARRAS